MQCNRSRFVIPPFQNLVDCPGGYHSLYMGARAEASSSFSVNVVGISGKLHVCYDPLSKKCRVDQSNLIYDGSKLKPDFC